MTKALLVHPDFSRLGGIETYFLKIRPHFSITHESCGNSGRPGEHGFISRILRISRDYLHYWRKVSDPEVSVVHLNPSLQKRMFYRDFIYLWIAKLHRKKTVVFFHGWDKNFEKSIDKQNGRIFRLLYGYADAFIVLASAFTDRIRAWGIHKPVYQEVIVIEDDVIAKSRLAELIHKREATTIKYLIFPARIMRAKGIFTTIHALKMVQKQYPDTGLIIAGGGEDMTEARELATSLGLNNIEFTGIVSGTDKYELFHRAYMLCFPTEHSEGFPNTIVEAMAFGMPVITRPVGGIKDFFKNEEHGYITDSTDYKTFAKYISTLLSDNKKYQNISRNNYHYASEHFLASRAAQRLENIYKSLCEQ